MSLSNIHFGRVLKGDRAVWMIFFFLCCVSIVEVYSASSRMTFSSGNHWAPLLNQFTFLVAGFIIVLVLHYVPCSKLNWVAPFFWPISMFLLILTTFGSGGSLNGTHRWTQIFGVSLQPSELVKGAMVFWTALVLARTQTVRRLDSGKIISGAVKGPTPARPFWFIVVPLSISCLVIFKDNVSTAVMLFTVIFVMMVIGKIYWVYLLKLAGTLVVLGGVVLFSIMTLPDEVVEKVPGLDRTLTVKHRIQRFDEDKAAFGSEEWKKQQLEDKNSQSTYAKVAIANSNGIGLWFGNSVQRDFLQHAESDFIYAIIIEESGVIGALVVMLLYLFLFMRTGKIAQKCRKFFPAYLVIGLGLMMTLQALVNMAVAVGAIPVTGQTLPFISRGGTSIIVTSFYFAVILSVSRYADAAQLAEKSTEPMVEGETTEYASEGNMS
ncbi:MAG: FtsW/RodA/SpoVE family cell cycle protein [Bacteroidaceae bacterium]|nr:FtsW/RodA/SpoVE family cell cycle protein [Bacteroidaceae bacterium]